MKRIVSLILSLFIITSAITAVPFSAQAAKAPYTIEEKQYGKILKTVYVYSIKKKNQTVEYTKKHGKTRRLNSRKRVVVLGKNTQNGSLLYIRFKFNKKQYYGYVNNFYVCVENKYNFKNKSVNKYNSYYKKKLKYKYFTYEGMPFYQFNQTGKSGSIKGLRISNSCGPHALAAAYSALYGDVITPETLMKNMKTDGINPRGNGSRVSKVKNGLHSYVENTYNLKYECKKILPGESFDYLKKGYMVILGVENLDGLKVFTGWSHYILLVGYDSVGNVITVNSNLKSKLFDSFSESRIKKNIVNSNFYRENTIAIRYKYNDKYKEFSDEVTCKLAKKALLTQHYNGMGKFFNLKKGTKISVIGTKKDKLYVSINNKGEEELGFVDRKAADFYVNVEGDKSVYTFNGKEHIPTVTVKDYRGKVVPEDEYELTYPEESTDVGVYRIYINYLGKYIGESYYEYSIIPKATSITKLTPKKHSVKIEWNMVEDEDTVNCYVIEYSPDKNFSESVDTIYVSSKKDHVTVRKLNRKTKYYFRIASSKAENDYTANSSWSIIRKAKTK